MHNSVTTTVHTITFQCMLAYIRFLVAFISMSTSLLMFIKSIARLELILTGIACEYASTFLDVASMSILQSKGTPTTRTYK